MNGININGKNEYIIDEMSLGNFGEVHPNISPGLNGLH